MQITLSVATSADGFMDDQNPARLMISSPEDWAAVQQLRATCDAILVGAATLRRDDPALLLRDERVRAQRVAQGLKPDITKVTLTRSGALRPDLRFFSTGDAERILFSNQPLEELSALATVLSTPEPITTAQIVTELERRGVQHLLVEGGASVLQQFITDRAADSLRLAINPALTLGDAGYARFTYTPRPNEPFRCERLGGMNVAHYALRVDTREKDLAYLQIAVDESRKCLPSPSCYRVGAVVVTADERVFTGYTHETSPTHHAEQEAIAKARAAGADLHGAAMYASLEPCSQRASEPKSCSQLLIELGFSHVAFALYEPACFVCCHGAQRMREAGLDVRHYPQFGEEILAINAHLFPYNR